MYEFLTGTQSKRFELNVRIHCDSSGSLNTVANGNTSEDSNSAVYWKIRILDLITLLIRII